MSIPIKNNDLVVYLPFDEGTGSTNYDYSGNGHNGTITGATWTKTPYGGKHALTFDGSGDYSQIAATADLAFDKDQDHTMIFWFKTNSATTKQIIFGHRKTGTVPIYYINIETDGRIRWLTGNPTTQTYSTNSITADTWYMVTVVWNDTDSKKYIYLNTTEEAAASVTQTGNFLDSVTYSRVGTDEAGSDGFNGEIDMPLIWNVALTHEEIKHIYRKTYRV